MKRVLVTRPAAQNQALLAELEKAGFEPVALPLLEIITYQTAQHAAQCIAIEQCVSHLADVQHIVFVSTNAVHCAFHWIKQHYTHIPQHIRWYPIGDATAKALAQYVALPETAGVDMDSETLLDNPHLQQLKGQQVVIFRGQGGRQYLFENLTARGAHVSFCEVYQRQFVRYPIGTLQQHLAQKIDFLQATSTETIQALLEQAIIESIRQQVVSIPLIVPGQRVTQFAKAQGFTQVLTSANAGLTATMDVIKNHNNC